MLGQLSDFEKLVEGYRYVGKQHGEVQQQLRNLELKLCTDERWPDLRDGVVEGLQVWQPEFPGMAPMSAYWEVLGRIQRFQLKYGVAVRCEVKPYHWYYNHDGRHYQWRVAVSLETENGSRSYPLEVEFDRGRYSLSEFNCSYVEFLQLLREFLPHQVDAPERLILCKVCRSFVVDGKGERCQTCNHRQQQVEKQPIRQQRDGVLKQFSLRLVKLGFQLEVTVGLYRLDFLHVEVPVAVEFDGREHDGAKKVQADKKRDRWLFQHHGIVTLRFPQVDVEQNLAGCLREAQEAVRRLSIE